MSDNKFDSLRTDADCKCATRNDDDWLSATKTGAEWLRDENQAGGRVALHFRQERDLCLSALKYVHEVWHRNCGRVYESMGSENPRAMAIDQAVDDAKAAITFCLNRAAERQAKINWEKKSTSVLTVTLTAFGQTAVFKDGKQVPELQVPWILLYGDFLESQGIDPVTVSLDFVGGKKGHFTRKQDGGFGWVVE